jgi:hypothetical protein
MESSLLLIGFTKAHAEMAPMYSRKESPSGGQGTLFLALKELWPEVRVNII